ncbi:flagellin hook IN motif-containing protein [Bradyrhizobium sp.]|uniref:flagellin hook IN motif-containing protein n=1 Tax=Bradyrhizobium sp. TaxID=376 RepID=UPI00273369CF|nr:flagellin hook IN motif-containing protein [Bradyrhizobium sp.]
MQQTNDLLSTTQNRLATGKKVNSANDNPTVFFAASALSNRAADLNDVFDRVVAASKVLKSTNDSLSALTGLVNSAQSTARNALASTATTARTTGSVAGLTGASSFAVVAARTITVNDGTTTATITSAGTVTTQQIIDGINNTANLRVKASLTADGKLQLEATTANAITIGGTITAPELSQFGLTAGVTAAGTLNSVRSGFAAQFDSIRSQIDQLSADATFDGTNLLNGGSLRINFNEKSTSSLSVVGVTNTSAGLGIAASAGTFQTDRDINNALTNLTNSLSTLRAQSSVFASNLDIVTTRQDFTKSLIGLLNAASDSMTAADTNEEGANLLALQTRQSLSSTALSMAAQADQTVLRMFR